MLWFILSLFREKLNCMSNHQALSMLLQERLSLLAFLHTPPAPTHCWQGAKRKQSDSLQSQQHNDWPSRLRPYVERSPFQVDRMYHQIHLALDWASLTDDTVPIK